MFEVSGERECAARGVYDLCRWRLRKSLRRRGRLGRLLPVVPGFLGTTTHRTAPVTSAEVTGRGAPPRPHHDARREVLGRWPQCCRWRPRHRHRGRAPTSPRPSAKNSYSP